MEDLFKKDILLTSLLNNPDQIYHLQGNISKVYNIKKFIDIFSEYRPTSDAFYSPIKYRSKLVGFLGQAKAKGSYREKDFYYDSILKDELFAGLCHFLTKEKISLLHQNININCAYFYIWHNNLIEIPSINNDKLLIEALEIPKIDTRMINNSVISKISENTQLLYSNKNGDFFIKKSKTRRGDNLNIITLVTIERVNSHNLQ